MSPQNTPLPGDIGQGSLVVTYFRSHLFAHLTSRPNVLRRQVVDWVKKGHMLEIKRDIYTLAACDHEVTVTPVALANVIQPI